jgi:hypothetical protein
VIDSLLKKLGKGGLDRKGISDRGEGIFSLSSAYITLETKLGLVSTNRCGISIKSTSGVYFSDTVNEVREFLKISSSEFRTEHVIVTDKYDYLWIMLKGMGFEDILVASNGIADIIIDRGLGDQMLAAAFEFRKPITPSSNSNHPPQLEPQFLIFNYKRGKFYPFVPLDAQEKRRSDYELTLMSIISKEVPWETDMSVWYPIWDMPFDKLRI